MLVEHPVDISIIMPMYNSADTVKFAVQSVFEQDFAGNVELIAVDDGSEDYTATRVAEMAEAEPDILVRLITQGNRGVAAARNAGLKYAAGEFVAFLDADDQLMPEFCSRMVTVARADNSDLVIGGRKKVSVSGDMRSIESEDVKDFGYSRYKAPFDQRFLADLFWEREMGNSVWNKLYRRELIGEFSIAQYYEDYPFNLDYISKCSSITAIPDTVYCYRIGTGKAIGDSRYGNCGWEAKVVEDYIVRGFVENMSGKRLSDVNLEKADAKFLRDAEEAIAGGIDANVVRNSNRHKEILARCR